MRIVIQRVKEAKVEINNKIHSAIKNGLLVLVGITDEDTEEDIKWISKKTVNLRIFDDENGIMNKSLLETEGELMLVSQFTLHASTRKGNRPSYIHASKPEYAIPLYEKLCSTLTEDLGKNIKTGVFGADMQIGLINDGPVTIIIDSKLKE